MLDSANETISELKEEIKLLSQEAEESRETAEAAELNAAQMKHDSACELDGLRYAVSIRRPVSLPCDFKFCFPIRQEIQAQELVIDDLNKSLKDCEDCMDKWKAKAVAAEADLRERNKVMAYAEDEINRCKVRQHRGNMQDPRRICCSKHLQINTKTGPPSRIYMKGG